MLLRPGIHRVARAPSVKTFHTTSGLRWTTVLLRTATSGLMNPSMRKPAHSRPTTIAIHFHMLISRHALVPMNRFQRLVSRQQVAFLRRDSLAGDVRKFHRHRGQREAGIALHGEVQ